MAEELTFSEAITRALLQSWVWHMPAVVNRHTTPPAAINRIFIIAPPHRATILHAIKKVTSLRCVWLSSEAGECLQIWTERPVGGTVSVHAAGVESRRDDEAPCD